VDEKKVGSKKAKVENVDGAARTKQLRYGNQKKWFTAFRYPPSPGYGGTRTTGHEEVTSDA